MKYDDRPAKVCNPPKDTQPYHPYYGDAAGQIPQFDGLPWWARVLCALGYHRWEERHGRKGGKLRDQCGRCTVLR